MSNKIDKELYWMYVYVLKEKHTIHKTKGRNRISKYSYTLRNDDGWDPYIISLRGKNANNK